MTQPPFLLQKLANTLPLNTDVICVQAPLTVVPFLAEIPCTTLVFSLWSGHKRHLELNLLLTPATLFGVPASDAHKIYYCNFNVSLFPLSVAPLEEVDYTSHDQIAHMNGGSSHEGLNGLNGHSGGSQSGPDSMTSASDLHRQLLNIPLTSEGSNHDSHNDSGYSTRLGFSAGPSPSLSGLCSCGNIEGCVNSYSLNVGNISIARNTYWAPLYGLYVVARRF